MKKHLTPNEISAFCRELRERKGWTHAKLAEAIGASSRQYIHNAETGKPGHLSAQRRILEYFGYEVEEVYRISRKEQP